MKDLSLEVSGMKCEGCAASVASALQGVAGVRRADVSLEESKARLVLEDDVRDEDLVRAVEKAGYGASAES